MEHRRHERHDVDWAAGYRLFLTDDWLPCRAVNMGRGGVAIEPLGESDDDRFVGDIDIRVEPDGTDPFELQGTIRHRTRTRGGGVLLGIEFVESGGDAFAMLDGLRRTSTG